MKTTQLALILLFALGTEALAEESYQPYIDHIKKKLGETTPVEDDGEEAPYIESIKKRLEAEHPSPQVEESYTEKFKASDPRRNEADLDESFTELEKAKLDPKPEGGAIQALLEGHSDLHAKKEGKIHHAFGLRYGAALTRNVTAPAGVQLRDFNDVYGANYAPDISLFYEFQPFHSEWFGNVGIMAMGGLGYFSGTGKFGFSIPKPGGGTFSSNSTTKFQFFTLPVTVAANYRFNLFRVLRPFVAVGPTAIGYVEMRNDSKKGNRGYSFSLFTSVGVALLLDWIAPGSAWDLYATYGIQHYYLTVEYSNLTTFSGDVNFAISGITAGIAFEY